MHINLSNQLHHKVSKRIKEEYCEQVTPTCAFLYEILVDLIAGKIQVSRWRSLLQWQGPPFVRLLGGYDGRSGQIQRELRFRFQRENSDQTSLSKESYQVLFRLNPSPGKILSQTTEKTARQVLRKNVNATDLMLYCIVYTTLGNRETRVT